MQRTMPSRSSSPDTTITGMRRGAGSAFIVASVAKPVHLRHHEIQQDEIDRASPPRAASSASRPSGASVVSWPSRSSRRIRVIRFIRLSSTTRTWPRTRVRRDVHGPSAGRRVASTAVRDADRVTWSRPPAPRAGRRAAAAPGRARRRGLAIRGPRRSRRRRGPAPRASRAISASAVAPTLRLLPLSVCAWRPSVVEVAGGERRRSCRQLVLGASARYASTMSPTNSASSPTISSMSASAAGSSVIGTARVPKGSARSAVR